MTFHGMPSRVVIHYDYSTNNQISFSLQDWTTTTNLATVNNWPAAVYSAPVPPFPVLLQWQVPAPLPDDPPVPPVELGIYPASSAHFRTNSVHVNGITICGATVLDFLYIPLPEDLFIGLPMFVSIRQAHDGNADVDGHAFFWLQVFDHDHLRDGNPNFTSDIQQFEEGFWFEPAVIASITVTRIPSVDDPPRPCQVLCFEYL
jgi:hypothetical protein